MSYKRLNNCLKASPVAAFLLFFQSAGAQAPLSDLDALVAAQAKTYKTEAVLLVGRADTVVYQKDTRMFTAARGQAPIGASSQWLTAALVLKLVDEGKLSLDDKVAQYLPVFEKYGKNFITLRHCLTHQTGIQADGKKLFNKKAASLEAAVDAIAAREIQTNPGTEFRYSDQGFLIVARVAEVVSKKKFDMLIQQKLLRPLGMRQTTFANLDGSLPDPVAGARSTAADYMRFLRMLLNGGKHNGFDILSAEAVASLRQLYSSAPAVKGFPRGMESLSLAAGAWADEPAGSQAGLLVAPSFGGTTPLVDFCRGYAFMLLLKEPDEDAGARPYASIKEVLDGKYRKECK